MASEPLSQPLSTRLNPRRRHGSVGRTVAVFAAVAWMVFVLLTTLLGLSGCSSSREVSYQPPTPAPTIVLPTETQHVYVPGPTVVLTDTIREESRPTAPAVITEYLKPRPDSLPVFKLYGFRVDSALTGGELTLYGQARELTYRLPALGEALVGDVVAPDSIEAYVEGEPEAPPPVRVECPACPECVVSATWGGRAKALLALLLTACLGAFAGFVFRPFLGR